MKIARVQAGEEIFYGCIEGSTIERLTGSIFDTPRRSGFRMPVAKVKLLAPFSVDDTRIFGIGFNYAAHVKETNHDVPPVPMIFFKPNSCLVGPGDPIRFPKHGENIHYESELVVVVGKRARRVSEATALDYVLGYTCGNDVSDRDLQRTEMKFGCLLAGKGFESFAPIGPVITTDLDPTKLDVIGRLNGVEVQHGNTSAMCFSVRQLVSYMSGFMTLEPGDMIMTGTPAGIGKIVPGDTYEVEIPGIGVLSNPVVADWEELVTS
jgi:2-keto-4-pentenoate hydratase/2-oxohepta-3-ene-1,7-dioic acid hydratase in catechol pathway